MKVKVVLDEVDVAHALVNRLLIRISEDYETWDDPSSPVEIVERQKDEYLLKMVRELLAKAHASPKNQLY